MRGCGVGRCVMGGGWEGSGSLWGYSRTSACSFHRLDYFKCLRVAHTNFYIKCTNDAVIQQDYKCCPLEHAYTQSQSACISSSVHKITPRLSSTTPIWFRSSAFSNPHEVSFVSKQLLSGREPTARCIVQVRPPFLINARGRRSVVWRLLLNKAHRRTCVSYITARLNGPGWTEKVLVQVLTGKAEIIS